jgi:hypothetical protein
MRLKAALNRTRGAWQDLQADRAERDHFAVFRGFYEALSSRRDIFYMFFTGGLLHWLVRAIHFVPDDVNLVILGSGLHSDEVSWLRQHVRRPLHVIELRVDDNTALDFVFRASRQNFGWLHIDCFVLNADLFREMAEIAPEVSTNFIWTNGKAGDHPVPHSAFVFVNQRAIEEIRRRGLPPSPRSYHYRGSTVGRYTGDRTSHSKVPVWRQIELLRRLLPAGADGLPVYPTGSSYFPLLSMFQLTAEALGFHLHPVRDLERGAAASSAQYSDEIIHVNGVATYRQVYREHAAADSSLPLVQFYPLLLQVDFAVLDQVGAETLPEIYRELHTELAAELLRLGIPPEGIRRNLHGFLQQRGIRPETCERIFGPA